MLKHVRAWSQRNYLSARLLSHRLLPSRNACCNVNLHLRIKQQLSEIFRKGRIIEYYIVRLCRKETCHSSWCYYRIIPQWVGMGRFCDCCRYERQIEDKCWLCSCSRGLSLSVGMCHRTTLLLCRCSHRPQRRAACDDRLMEVVGGRRSGSSGQGELGNWEKVGSLGDNEDRLIGVWNVE